LNQDVVGPVHDVEVRQDDALGVNDKARAEAEPRRIVGRHVKGRAAELLEEFAKLLRDAGIVKTRAAFALRRLQLRLGTRLDLGLGLDADDGGKDPLDDVAIRREFPRNGRHGGRLTVQPRADKVGARQRHRDETTEYQGPSFHNQETSCTGTAGRHARGRSGPQPCESVKGLTEGRTRCPLAPSPSG
jgi:hypothetical protein